MNDTYLVTSVQKTIGTSGAVSSVVVTLQNQTNTFGPSQLTVTIKGDFTVKPNDTHTLTLT